MENEKLFTQLLFSRDHERKKNWIGIGSATFVHLDNKFFLITAAHVFSENQKYACLLNINGTPINLAYYKIEKNSEMDIAAICLEEKDYLAIAEHTFFVTEDMLRPNSEEAQATSIILMGYPSSRNKEKFRDTGFTPTLWRHISIDCSEKLQLKNEHYQSCYFATAYDPKNTENEHRKRERTPDSPRGISGGIALELSITTIGTLRLAPIGMIQGIKQKSHLIYGITFKYIFAWLRHNSAYFLTERVRPHSS